MNLPLEGIKVLDLSRLLPGPFCTWVLGDFGADIIRVEEPQSSEQPTGRRASQSIGTSARAPLSASEREIRAAYDSVGRNKKSIVLQLRNADARAVVYKLAERSDVFVEEFRPGVAKRLGVDYETIREINPRIVYCSISLYGQTGPYRDYPGHDPCALAVAGALALGADPTDRPRLSGIPVADVSAGLHAVVAILLALRARDLTGKGQYLDISMTDCALDYLCWSSPANFRGRSQHKLGDGNPSLSVWKAKDGKYLCTTNGEAYHWANFCRCIGREDFIPHQWNREKMDEMYQAISDIFMTKTREEWLTILRNPESQVAPVNELADVFDDPQVLQRQMAIELNHPTQGKVRQQATSIKLSETPAQIRSFAPFPGQHTRDILEDLGYSDGQIGQLIQGGAVQ